MSGGEIIKGRKKVAQRFGVAEQTIRMWEAHRGMPIHAKGRQGVANQYSVDAIDKWHTATIAEPEPDDQHAEQTRQWRADELRIKVERAALAYRLEAGELISRRAVAAEVSSLFNRIRGRLEQIPDELAREIPAKDRAAFTQVAKNKIHNVLTELYQWSIDDHVQ